MAEDHKITVDPAELDALVAAMGATIKEVVDFLQGPLEKEDIVAVLEETLEELPARGKAMLAVVEAAVAYCKEGGMARLHEAVTALEEIA